MLRAHTYNPVPGTGIIQWIQWFFSNAVLLLSPSDEENNTSPASPTPPPETRTDATRTIIVISRPWISLLRLPKPGTLSLLDYPNLAKIKDVRRSHRRVHANLNNLQTLQATSCTIEKMQQQTKTRIQGEFLFKFQPIETMQKRRSSLQNVQSWKNRTCNQRFDNGGGQILPQRSPEIPSMQGQNDVRRSLWNGGS